MIDLRLWVIVRPEFLEGMITDTRGVCPDSENADGPRCVRFSVPCLPESRDTKGSPDADKHDPKVCLKEEYQG